MENDDIPRLPIFSYALSYLMRMTGFLRLAYRMRQYITEVFTKLFMSLSIGLFNASPRMVLGDGR